MRASLKHALALLPALAAAAVLPPTHRPHQRSSSPDDVKPVVLELGMLPSPPISTMRLLMIARCSKRSGNVQRTVPRLPWRLR